MSDNSKFLIESLVGEQNNLKTKLNKKHIKKNTKNKKIDKRIINYKNNDKKRIVKIRNPGVDMVRILGMYAIVIHHILLHGKVHMKFQKYTELNLLLTFCFFHVSSFALISGVVGYKTNKYSNLIYLWLWVFFYSVVIHYTEKKFKPQWIISGPMLYDLFPVIFYRYWYFTQYFGMYLFLPVINKGISLINQTELKLLVFSTITVYIVWKDIINPMFDSFKMDQGFSVLWLLIFYLTGAYIGKYRVDYIGIKKIFFCFGCIFIFFFSTLLL